MEALIYTSNHNNLTQLQNGDNFNSLVTIQKNLQASLQTFKDNSFQKIIIEPSNLSEINQTTLNNLYSVLKPGGSLKIVSSSEQSSNSDSIKDLYTIAGFKEEAGNNAQGVTLTKPSWAGKGVATLKKKNNDTNTNGASASSNTNSSTAVKIGVEDDTVLKNGTQESHAEVKKANPFAAFSSQAADNKQTIEEENLLHNEADYNKLGANEECSTKPKACANCSCGRAELEAAAEAGENVDLAKNIETGKVASSCGNCYLGDAFRCGSCPYKGLPAFKPGDKVELDLSKDNIGGVLKEDTNVVVSNGKVKLQI